MVRKPIAGIYQIQNTVTGDCYVGSSQHVYDRWHEHKRMLRQEIHRNKHLQAAWNKYGESAFIHRVLEECSVITLIECEQKWIDVLKPSYNNRKTAAYVERDRKDTEETIAKRKRPVTKAQQEALEQGRQVKQPKIKSPETIAAIKKARANQKITQKQLDALAEGREKRKQDEYPATRAGVKTSGSTRWKQSLAATKRYQGEETIKELEALKKPAKEKKKRDSARYAFTQTEEYRKKQREARAKADAEGRKGGRPPKGVTEHIRKLAQLNTGRSIERDPEASRKSGETRKGRKRIYREDGSFYYV